MAVPAKTDSRNSSLKARRISGKPSQATYDTDYYGWVQEQVKLLKAGHADRIDVENIVEELEDMGRSEYRIMESALRGIFTHMLKWDHQPEKRTPSWVYSIAEGRRRFFKSLKNSPSLKSKQDEAFQEAYIDARHSAVLETFLDITDFPEECPYSWDDVLNRPFDLEKQ